MTVGDIQREIVGILPSGDLRREVVRRGHVFAPQELLQLAYRYAPEHETRMLLLARLAAEAPEIAPHARALMAHEQRQMADFLSRQPGAVWDLIVQEEGVQWQQRFLCASWEATLSQLMLYQEHYKGIEGNAEAYSVDKRQILAAGEDVEDDVLGTCSLDAAGRIIALDMWDGKNEWGECCDDCDACPRICISRMDDVACPVFVRPWDFVRYRGLGGWQNYGVAAPWEALRALESELMVYRVDAQTVQDTSPDAAFWSHWHVLLPEVEVVKADALPPSLRDAAQAFRARLMAQMEQQEERNIRPSFDVPLPSGRGSML